MIKEVPNPTLECIGCIFKDALQCLSMPCFADKDNPIKYIEVNEDINENNMNKKVSEFVRKYVKEHLDKSDLIMDRNQAKEFYPILQAFAEGKAIECRTKPSALSKSWQGMNDWTEIKEIGYWDNIEYRIKPEPKYRPFKDAKECWQEMQKHQPFGWVKYADKYISISAIDSDNDYEIDFDDYTFADSTPFGVKIEE